MLVLTRRIGETLLLGDDVNIVVLSVRGKQIQLGIEAPRSMPIHREELRLRMAAEADQNAAITSPAPRPALTTRVPRRCPRRRRR